MRSRPSEWCFRHRVELASFIGGIGFVFFLFTPVHFTRMAARLFFEQEEFPIRAVYVLLAIGNMAAAALRIWAGGTIGGARMMSVSIRADDLLIAGPYRHVRNPIYLSDIMTLAGMALVVPWPGTILVIALLAGIYPKIIAYEEKTLLAAFGERYARYAADVPRLGWRMRVDRDNGASSFSFAEGVTHNFIYLPLIPGFLAAAVTGVLWHGVAIGAVGPLGWIGLHFYKNFRSGGLARGDGDAAR